MKVRSLIIFKISSFLFLPKKKFAFSKNKLFSVKKIIGFPKAKADLMAALWNPIEIIKSE